ncbi:MAG: HAMP domain-containing histidine kinase [Deltaproteobacteria bacterium]|nr:HAMP domain-containing histidine kinase [Deltaproteobacteria bacterium]
MAQKLEDDGLEAMVKALGAQVAEGDRLRSAFMQNVAHELSTPLTPLAGYVKILLAERLGPLPPQQRKVVESMAAAVARLTRVVENISDFANLSSGQATPLVAPVEVDALVAEVVEEQRAAIKEARLHVQVLPGGGPPVKADRRKLRQALGNLFSNAVKFSPHGGEVLVTVTRAGGKLRIAIWDQGPGIPGEDQAHVFEPFFHATRSSRSEARRPGSGLGLSVASRIAEAHGGRVELQSPPVENHPGEGDHTFSGTMVALEIPER